MTEAFDALLSPLRPASSADDAPGLATINESRGRTLPPFAGIYTSSRPPHTSTSSFSLSTLAGPQVHPPGGATLDTFAGRRRFTTLENLWDIKSTSPQVATKTPLLSKLSVSPAAISEKLQRLRETSPLWKSQSNNKNGDFTISAAGGLHQTPLSLEKSNASNVPSFTQLKAELERRDTQIAKLLSTAKAAKQERERACERISRLETKLAQIHLSPSSRKLPIASISATPAAVNAEVLRYSCNQDASSSLVQPNASSQGDNILAFLSPSNVEQCISSQAKQATETLSVLDQEAETLRHRAELAAAELQGQSARAEAAEKRARLAEARASASTGDAEAAKSDVCALRQHVEALQGQVRRLTTELAASEDRTLLLDAALGEERRKGKRRGTGAVAAAEVALTAQVRALTAQLQATKSENGALKQEVASLRSSSHGQAAERERANAVVLSANRELEAALSQAANDLEARAQELQSAQELISRLSDENKTLRVTADEWQRRAEQENATTVQTSERLAASERTIAELTAQVRESKTRAAQLEDSMRRQSDDDGASAFPLASPLQDAMGTLRAELQHRELRLVSLEEELAAERRRASELQKQVFDQAEELENFARRGRNGEMALRAELEAASAEILQLHEQLKVMEASAGNQKNEGDPTAEISQLREALVEREAEVMLLQGQINMLRGFGVENWLTMDA